jgi:hypothetical protein
VRGFFYAVCVKLFSLYGAAGHFNVILCLRVENIIDIIFEYVLEKVLKESELAASFRAAFQTLHCPVRKDITETTLDFCQVESCHLMCPEIGGYPAAPRGRGSGTAGRPA